MYLVFVMVFRRVVTSRPQLDVFSERTAQITNMRYHDPPVGRQ